MTGKKKVAFAVGFGIAANVFYSVFIIGLLSVLEITTSGHDESGWVCLLPIDNMLSGFVYSLPLVVSTSFLVGIRGCFIKPSLVTYLYCLVFVLLRISELFYPNSLLVPPVGGHVQQTLTIWYVFSLMMICLGFTSLICLARKYIKSYYKYAMIFGSIGSISAVLMRQVSELANMMCLNKICLIVFVVSSVSIAFGYWGLYRNRKTIGRIIDTEKLNSIADERDGKAPPFYADSIMAIGLFVFILNLSFAIPNGCSSEWGSKSIVNSAGILVASIFLGGVLKRSIKVKHLLSSFGGRMSSAMSPICLSITSICDAACMICFAVFAWSLFASDWSFITIVVDGFVKNLNLIDQECVFRIAGCMNVRIYFLMIVLFMAWYSFVLARLFSLFCSRYSDGQAGREDAEGRPGALSWFVWKMRNVMRTYWISFLGVLVCVWALAIALDDCRPEIDGLFGEKLGDAVVASCFQDTDGHYRLAEIIGMSELKDPKSKFSIVTSPARSTKASYFAKATYIAQKHCRITDLMFASCVSSKSQISQFMKSADEIVAEFENKYGKADLEDAYADNDGEISLKQWFSKDRTLVARLSKQGNRYVQFCAWATSCERSAERAACSIVCWRKDGKEWWNRVKGKLPIGYVTLVERRIPDHEENRYRISVVDPKVRAFLKEHLNVQLGDSIDRFKPDGEGNVVIPFIKPCKDFDEAVVDHMDGKIIGISLHTKNSTEEFFADSNRKI